MDKPWIRTLIDIFKGFGPMGRVRPSLDKSSTSLWYISLLMVRETRVQSQVESYQRRKKMVLDTSLLNTQYYKVRIKGKVEQSRERSSALPYTSV